MTNSSNLASTSPKDRAIFDVEAAQTSPITPAQRAAALRTGAKVMAMGLCMTTTAGMLALSLLNDAKESNMGMRRLQDDNDGCGPGQYRSILTDKKKHDYKWAMVGEAGAAGLGLVIAGAGLVAHFTERGGSAMGLGATFVLAGVCSLGVTALAYGLEAGNNGKCVTKG